MGETVKHGDYEWDTSKAKLNRKKHGVSFEEAITAFNDVHALQLSDPRYADRFILIGMSDRARVLFVVHCEIDDSGGYRHSRTRVISARIAHKTEALQYALGDAQ